MTFETSTAAAQTYAAQTYVALHLGDHVLSVVRASDSGVAEFRFALAMSVDTGVPVFLSTGRATDRDVVSRGAGPPEGRVEISVDGPLDRGDPWAFVDDTEMLVGSSPMRVVDVFGGTIAAALQQAGVAGRVDLLEIACPSNWGITRQDVVHRAARLLAREVSVVDSAAAAAMMLGERAPSFAVVVELRDVSSTVCTLVADSPTGENGPNYRRTGRWDAVGVRDVLDTSDDDTTSSARKSLRERISVCASQPGGRDVVDVFVVAEHHSAAIADALDPHSPHRVHAMEGIDVVRSMAARAGICGPVPASNFGNATTPAPARHPDHEESDVVGPHLVDRHSVDPSSVDPNGYDPNGYDFDRDESRPVVRAGAWLSEVQVDPRSRRSIPWRAVGVFAVVGLVVAAGITALGIEMFGPSAAPVAIPARQQPLAAVSPTRAPPTRASPTRAAPVPSTSGPSPSSVPTPETRRFAFGRASVELPVAWSERVEAARTLLIPSDLPERRIVLTTRDLLPGSSLDRVAVELAARLDAAGAESRIEDLSAATDFGARRGVSYREVPGDGSSVLWRVFVEDDLQINIGCQSEGGAEEVLAVDCDRAVASLSVRAAN